MSFLPVVKSFDSNDNSGRKGRAQNEATQDHLSLSLKLSTNHIHKNYTPTIYVKYT